MCKLIIEDGKPYWLCSNGAVYQPDYMMRFPSAAAWHEFFQGRADRHCGVIRIGGGDHLPRIQRDGPSSWVYDWSILD